jgi:hypothetical protein
MMLTRREALRAMGLGGAGVLAGCHSAKGWSGGTRWYRGNLHMHTYWSDGRAFPEQAVDAYKRLGYDFVGLSDHNVFADDAACWRPVEEKEGKWPPVVTQPLFDEYAKGFGRDLETRVREGKTEVRLKTYDEMRRRFDEPGKFLLLPAVEITQTLNGIQVHMNALNLPDVIPFVKGGALNKQIADEAMGVGDLIRRDAAEVAALAARLRRPSMLTLNHPQWVYWDIAPQNLIDNPEVRFFEVCNGGSAFAPQPQAAGVNNETFWDAVNAFRASKGQPLLYGIGTDDTHIYFNRKPEHRIQDAWVMVRSAALTPDALLAAMQAGDFYATCGVTLDEVDFSPASRTLRVKAKAEPGAGYRIRFIATKKGFDPSVRHVDAPAEKGRGARRIPVYSTDIGRTVQVAEGAEASYRLASDDLYVRARVESDLPCGYSRHFHPETLVAWTQPYGPS